jgi:hypothetical protein
VHQSDPEHQSFATEVIAMRTGRKHWMTAAREVVGCVLSQFKALMASI